MATLRQLTDYNDPETRYIYSFVIFGIIILTGGSIILGLTASAYEFYLTLFISTLIIWGLALSLIDNRTGNRIEISTFGNIDKSWKLIAAIAIGVAIALLLGSQYLSNSFKIFDLAILVPPTAAVAVGATSGFQSVVTDFMAPFVEETWRNSALIPLIAAGLGTIGIGPIVFFLGGIIALILVSSYFWIGILLAAAGIGIWLYSLAKGKKGRINSHSKLGFWSIFIIATIMGNIVWAALHIFAYSQEQVPNFYSALFGVFALGMLISIINLMIALIYHYIKPSHSDFTIASISIIPGLIIHSILNGIIEGITLGTGPIVGAIISTFLIVYIIMIFRPKAVPDAFIGGQRYTMDSVGA